MTDGIDPRVLASVDESRRDILRKLVIGSAFVVPAIASFPMDALAESKATITTGNIRGIEMRANPGAAKPAGPTTPGTTQQEPTRR